MYLQKMQEEHRMLRCTRTGLRKNAPWVLAVNLTKEQIHRILVAFDPEYVMVTYWDPLEGQDVTKEFYTGDMEANVKWWAKGHERYSTLDFDVIER